MTLVRIIVSVAALATLAMAVRVHAQAIARGDGLVVERYGADWCGHTAKVIVRPAGKMDVKLSDPAVQRLLGTARIGLSMECPQATRIVVYVDGPNGVTQLAEATASNGWTFAELRPLPPIAAAPPPPTPSYPQAMPVRDFPALLTGIWRGNYCGGSSTTWWIDASPKRAWAREHWCNAFTCGDVDYRIVQISNAQRRLEMKSGVGTAFSLSNYSVLFQVSGDGNRLDGIYHGHPRCSDVHLTRVGELGAATPLASSTIAPLPRSHLSITVTTTQYEQSKICYAAAMFRAYLSDQSKSQYQRQTLNEARALRRKAVQYGVALGMSESAASRDVTEFASKRSMDYLQEGGEAMMADDFKQCLRPLRELDG